MRLRWLHWASLMLLGLVAACADTTDPLPPAAEVLLVVNSTEASLSIIPVESPSAGVTVPLGGPLLPRSTWPHSMESPSFRWDSTTRLPLWTSEPHRS